MLQSFDSKPRFAPVVLSFVFPRAMVPPLASVIKAAAPCLQKQYSVNQKA
jgi:hypothetical protein